MSAINWNPVLDHLEHERDEINDLIIRIRRIAGMAGPTLTVPATSSAAAAVAPPTRRKPGPKPGLHKRRGPVRRKSDVSHQEPPSVHKTPPAAHKRTCRKNPEHTEFYGGGKGACIKCAKEAQKRYAAKRKKHAAAPPDSRQEDDQRPPLQDRQPEHTEVAAPDPPSPPERDQLPSDTPRQLVYSVKTRCSKCGNMTRLSREKDANPKTDYWTCMMRGCQIRISHIILAADKQYEGAA